MQWQLQITISMRKKHFKTISYPKNNYVEEINYNQSQYNLRVDAANKRGMGCKECLIDMRMWLRGQALVVSHISCSFLAFLICLSFLHTPYLDY